MWFDALRWLTLQARAGSHALSIAGVDCTVRLGSPAERQLAWTTLSAICMPLDAVTRGHAISQLQERLGVALPERPVAEYAAMDWSLLRALDARLIEVGAHTRTHTRLTSCTLEGQREEIAGCKSEIEHNVGRPVQAFCYPNGMPEDFSAQSAALVQACGFRSAVQAFGGLVGSDSNLFGLARVSAPTDFAQFRNCVNGLWSLRETHMDGAAAT